MSLVRARAERMVLGRRRWAAAAIGVTAISQTTLRTVTVQLVEHNGQQGYRVLGAQGQVHLHTGRAGAADWAKAEWHLRGLFGRPTLAEQMAECLNGILEQYGDEHPAGAKAKAALIQAGMD